LVLKILIGFKDTEPVKVITGIRRCGKSSLLKLMANHLRLTGISEDQIIEMNFESTIYRGYDAITLYQSIKQRIPEGKKSTSFSMKSNTFSNGKTLSIRLCIRVTESMRLPETRERELAPLRMVHDSFTKADYE